MPTVDYAYFISILPEFDGKIGPLTVDALNGVAPAYVSESVYKEQTRYALALAIAHLYTLGQMRGAGPVSSVATGEVNESYAALATEKGSMAMTTYGLRLRELGRMMRPGGVWTGGQEATLPPPFGGMQRTWDR